MSTYYSYHYASNGHRIKKSEYRDSEDNIIKFGLELSKELGRAVLIRKYTCKEHGKDHMVRLAVCEYPYVR